MRTLTFCFIISLVPIIGQSQTTKNTISLIGGAEYQNSETTGWNVEFNYKRPIKSSRFYSEFGLNYSILEYNKMQKTNLEGVCLPYFSLSSAGIQFSPESGYYHHSEIKYSSQRAFRIQAGINYHIIENSKLTLSGGLNFVNQVIAKTYQHGEYILFPADCADSLPILRGNISGSSGGNRFVGFVNATSTAHGFFCPLFSKSFFHQSTCILLARNANTSELSFSIECWITI